MDNNQLQYIKIQSQYADKVEQFEKCVVKAAKLTHAIADTAEKKCKQARMARCRQHLCANLFAGSG